MSVFCAVKKSPSLVRGRSALVAPLFCFYVFASLRGDACRGDVMCGGVQFFCFFAVRAVVVMGCFL